MPNAVTQHSQETILLLLLLQQPRTLAALVDALGLSAETVQAMLQGIHDGGITIEQIGSPVHYRCGVFIRHRE